MCVYPAKCHDRISNLCLKEFNLSIISHCTLVLLTSLWRHNQRINEQLAITLNPRQDSTSFDLIAGVSLCDAQEMCNYVDWADHCFQTCVVLEWWLSGLGWSLGCWHWLGQHWLWNWLEVLLGCWVLDGWLRRLYWHLRWHHRRDLRCYWHLRSIGDLRELLITWVLNLRAWGHWGWHYQVWLRVAWLSDWGLRWWHTVSCEGRLGLLTGLCVYLLTRLWESLLGSHAWVRTWLRQLWRFEVIIQRWETLGVKFRQTRWLNVVIHSWIALLIRLCQIWWLEVIIHSRVADRATRHCWLNEFWLCCRNKLWLSCRLRQIRKGRHVVQTWHNVRLHRRRWLELIRLSSCNGCIWNTSGCWVWSTFPDDLH